MKTVIWECKQLLGDWKAPRPGKMIKKEINGEFITFQFPARLKNNVFSVSCSEKHCFLGFLLRKTLFSWFRCSG
jgi:hypothetical protein